MGYLSAPDIAGVAGMGAAIQYLVDQELEAVAAYEQDLLRHANEALERIPGVRLIGTAPRKAGVLSFVMDDAHPHDIGTIVEVEGLAIRTRHHCAQPVMDREGPVDKEALHDRVTLVLKDVYDPEIPVNVHDLGLIYGLEIDDEGNVEVEMTPRWSWGFCSFLRNPRQPRPRPGRDRFCGRARPAFHRHSVGGACVSRSDHVS